jgi:hypothetical protein
MCLSALQFFNVRFDLRITGAIPVIKSISLRAPPLVGRQYIECIIALQAESPRQAENAVREP